MTRHTSIKKAMSVKIVGGVLLALFGATATLRGVTVLSENFEGSFPGANGWTVGDGNSTGTPAHWGKVKSAFGVKGRMAARGKAIAPGSDIPGRPTAPPTGIR